MEIQDIKATLSIRTVLNHYHLSPDRNNRINCPWHDDKTPSLQIYPKTNTWTCFSSNCSAGSGDTIEMIQKMEKCTKHEALKKAAELCGEIKSQPGVAELFTMQRKSLHRTKKALQYLKDRNPRCCQVFREVQAKKVRATLKVADVLGRRLSLH